MKNYNINLNLLGAVLWVLLYVIIVELSGVATLITENFGYYSVSYFYAGLLSLLLIYLLLKRINIGGLTFKITDNKWLKISFFLGILFKFFLIPLNFIYDWITNESHTIKLENNIQVFINEISFNHVAFIFLAPITEELFLETLSKEIFKQKNHLIIRYWLQPHYLR